MKVDDIPRVHEIDVLSFALPWPVQSYRFELTENPTTQAIVAELQDSADNAQIIGMSVVWIVIDEAHIATIAIHPEFRGRGFGKKLLVESLRRSIEHGARLATLEVREHNLIALQMYRQFGFRIAGRRSRYYKDNQEDAIIMTLEKMDAEYLARLNLSKQ